MWWTYDGQAYGTATAQGRRDRLQGGTGGFLDDVYVLAYSDTSIGYFTMQFLHTVPGDYPTVGTFTCASGNMSMAVSPLGGIFVSSDCTITVFSVTPQVINSVTYQRIKATFSGTANGKPFTGTFDMPFS